MGMLIIQAASDTEDLDFVSFVHKASVTTMSDAFEKLPRLTKCEISATSGQARMIKMSLKADGIDVACCIGLPGKTQNLQVCESGYAHQRSRYSLTLQVVHAEPRQHSSSFCCSRCRKGRYAGVRAPVRVRWMAGLYRARFVASFYLLTRGTPQISGDRPQTADPLHSPPQSASTNEERIEPMPLLRAGHRTSVSFDQGPDQGTDHVSDHPRG
eukprot:scaffold7092_cov262-Pinguiococcus_pyrenoidosus.AAC.6